MFSFGNGSSGRLDHGGAASQPWPKRVVVALANARAVGVAATIRWR